MKYVYLALALVGTVVPYAFFLSHFQADGVGLGTFVGAAFSNGAAGGLAADILISSTVFWIWLFRSGAKRPWAYIVLNLVIGLSCAFPAYLYVRERGKDTIGPTA